MGRDQALLEVSQPGLGRRIAAGVRGSQHFARLLKQGRQSRERVVGCAGVDPGRSRAAWSRSIVSISSEALKGTVRLNPLLGFMP